MAKYRDALFWIVANDDTEWLNGEEGTAEGQGSVTAALVADLFGKSDAQVRADLLRERRKYLARITRRIAHSLAS